MKRPPRLQQRPDAGQWFKNYLAEMERKPLKENPYSLARVLQEARIQAMKRGHRR